jgi:hypothetical protein
MLNHTAIHFVNYHPLKNYGYSEPPYLVRVVTSRICILDYSLERSDSCLIVADDEPL